MDAITADRSQLLTEEEQLAGQTLLSLETTDEFGEDDFYVYASEHFASWLPLLRLLNLEQQELLLSYYVLGKTQHVLARLFDSTQTMCSFRIRMTVKLVGTFILWGGPPDVETMERILLKAGCQHKLKKVALSEVIVEYAGCRNFEQISLKYNLHRPDIRRAMSQTAKHLLGGNFTYLNDGNSAGQRTPEELALGAYIFTLIDKANPAGRGLSKRKLAKMVRCLVLQDPPCVGQFRVDVNDPGWDAMFVSRANR